MRSIRLPKAFALACGATAAFSTHAAAQFAPSINARSWIEGEASTSVFGTAGGEAVGGEFSIPDPSIDYSPLASILVYFNGDATANRLRNSYFVSGTVQAMFLWNSLVDTYTISGPPGSEGTPVNARVKFRATGTIFVGPTVSPTAHFGLATARLELGTWGASADPAFPEDFRVSPFDTSGNFLKSVSIPSGSYGATRPELAVDLLIDQTLTRTVGTPFDVAFGMSTTGSGAGNLRAVPSPEGSEYIVATIDWELPAGYTITSVLGWTDPDAPSPHCRVDFDGDGDPGTDADIEAFFACLGGACCPTCGSDDFDGDGDAGTDADIESFFRMLGGGPC